MEASLLGLCAGAVAARAALSVWFALGPDIVACQSARAASPEERRGGFLRSIA